ncbi:MAG: carboxypeptidase-like regulatory domain-containing protein [Acidobacteriota bacterium]
MSSLAAVAVALLLLVNQATWPARTLAGTVVGPDGEPVTGAEVRVFGPSSLEIGRVRASDQGRFRLVVARDGDYEVLALAPGLAPASESVTLPAGSAAVQGLRLTLGTARTARGRVEDEGGHSLAGARVELARSQADELRPDGSAVDEDLYQAETGEDGRFEIPGLPEGWFDLEASRPGLLPTALQGLEVSGAQTDLGTVTLRQGASLTGRIVGPDQEPLAGATVRLASGESVASGPDGRFEIADLDPGKKLELEACRPGRVTVAYESETLPAEPVEILLLPAARLTGRVVGPDGAPAAGASVATSSDTHPNPPLGPASACPPVGRAQATTDAEGRFVLDSLLGGRIHVWATKAGTLGSGIESLEIPDGGEAEAPTLKLAPGATVTGRVLREDGSPAPAAQVFIERSADSLFFIPSWADGDGRYRIEGVPPGKQTILARHETLGTGSREIELAAGGENQADITLAPEEPPHMARGRVVDPDGEPVAGALVRNGQVTVYTNAGGAFSIPVEENGYELVARKAGYAPAYLTQWAAGGAREDLELRLGREASVSGRLLGFDPSDLAETRVSAFGADSGMQIPGLVSSDGTYRVQGLSPGEWLVSAGLGDRSADARVEIAPDDPEILQDLSLPGRFEVRGRVIDADGAPVEEAEVRIAVVGRDERNDSDSQSMAVSGEDGAFSMEAEDGTYEIVAWREGSGLSGGGRFTVAGAPVDGLEVRLAPMAVLTGRLLGIPEEELADAEVRVELGSFGSAGEIEPGEEGAPPGYRFDDLGPGAWTLRAHAGAEEVVRRVTLKPGDGPVEMDLPFSFGDLSLAVRVTGYREIRGTLWLRKAGDRPNPWMKTLENGVFVYEHLRPGRYVLTFYDDRNVAVLRREVDLAASQELEIDLGSL